LLQPNIWVEIRDLQFSRRQFEGAKGGCGGLCRRWRIERSFGVRNACVRPAMRRLDCCGRGLSEMSVELVWIRGVHEWSERFSNSFEVVM
jgi:hypothetical protein